jgi:hypothetical protein
LLFTFFSNSLLSSFLSLFLPPIAFSFPFLIYWINFGIPCCPKINVFWHAALNILLDSFRYFK